MVVQEEQQELWQLPAPEDTAVADRTAVRRPDNKWPDEPEIVVEKTMIALAARGYCHWTCSAFDSAVICIVEDEHVSVIQERHRDVDPETLARALSYPIYTLDELEKLSESPIPTQRLLYEAKLASPGTLVTKVETPRKQKHETNK
jgi:hypothetical protein